jgi:hypothetical protein
MHRPAALALYGLLTIGLTGLVGGLIACGPPPAKNTAKKVGKDDRPDAPSQLLSDIKFQESPPGGDPAVVGCADGQREGFADIAKFPTIAGCVGTWEGDMTLRKGPVAKRCGDDLEACDSPSSVCSPGWHVCARDGDFHDLTDRVDAKGCNEGAGPGRFNAGISHVKKKKECAPVPTETTRYPCLKDGYGAEPVCCGLDCRFGQCRDSVWEKQTRISVGKAQGCGAVASDRNGGVLCCKDKEPAPTIAPLPATPVDPALPVDGPTGAPETGTDAPVGAPDEAKPEEKKPEEKKPEEKKKPADKADEKSDAKKSE